MKSLVIYDSDHSLKNVHCIEKSECILQGTVVKFALIDAVAPQTELPSDSVIVQKMAFSCNYRDIGIILMEAKRIAGKKSLVPIGSEFSGVVIKTGKTVRGIKVGDRVIPNGNYPAEQANGRLSGLPTNHASLEFEVFHYKKLLVIPEKMSFETGAGFTIGAQTASSMVKRLDIKTGRRVLLTGITSNTSLFALALLKGLNCEIYATTRNKDKFKNYHLISSEHLFEVKDSIENLMEIDEIHENVSIYGKFDYVIDPFSDSNLMRLLELIAVNGKYITCGTSNQFFKETKTFNAPAFFGRLIMNNITIMGNCLGSTQALKRSVKLYEEGRFEIVPFRIFKNDIGAFLENTFNRKNELGKMIFSY